jgi:hypothetical protein
MKDEFEKAVDDAARADIRVELRAMVKWLKEQSWTAGLQPHRDRIERRIQEQLGALDHMPECRTNELRDYQDVLRHYVQDAKQRLTGAQAHAARAAKDASRDARVAKLIAQGMPTEAAVAKAIEEYGVKRSAIFASRKRHRSSC